MSIHETTAGRRLSTTTMNDADLGDNIQDHADVAEGRMATSNPFEQEQAHRISR